MELIDNRNGTAVLSITDSPAPGSQAAVSISADVGYFADTAQFILETFSATANAVTVAPNPFSESVRILISAEVGIRSAVTIYNTSGERIWGQVNNSGILADTSIVWNGRNSKGKATAAGIFILHVRAASYEGRLKLLKTN